MLVAASGHREDIDTLEAFVEIREQCEPALRGGQRMRGLAIPTGRGYEYEQDV